MLTHKLSVCMSAVCWHTFIHTCECRPYMAPVAPILLLSTLLSASPLLLAHSRPMTCVYRNDLYSTCTISPTAQTNGVKWLKALHMWHRNTENACHVIANSIIYTCWIDRLTEDFTTEHSKKKLLLTKCHSRI